MSRNKRKHGYIPVLQEASHTISQPYSMISASDIAELKSYCMAPIEQFYDKWGMKDNYVFIPSNRSADDKSKRVLAVGHLDCYSSAFYTSPDNQSIYSACLDDRLGVWAICRKLPSLLKNGRDYDILLTTGEEDGLSTASAFYDRVGLDQYNWVFELDRRGCDAVHYGFTEPEWLAALHNDGWDMKKGSFSDIVEFEDGDISAVNFGIAYAGEHSNSCHVDVRKLEIQLMRIASFYTAHSRIKYHHYNMAYTSVPTVPKFGQYTNARGSYTNKAGVWGYHDSDKPYTYGVNGTTSLGATKIQGA